MIHFLYGAGSLIRNIKAARSAKVVRSNLNATNAISPP